MSAKREFLGPYGKASDAHPSWVKREQPAKGPLEAALRLHRLLGLTACSSSATHKVCCWPLPPTLLLLPQLSRLRSAPSSPLPSPKFDATLLLIILHSPLLSIHTRMNSSASRLPQRTRVFSPSAAAAPASHRTDIHSPAPSLPDHKNKMHHSPLIHPRRAPSPAITTPLPPPSRASEKPPHTPPLILISSAPPANPAKTEKKNPAHPRPPQNPATPRIAPFLSVAPNIQ